MAISTDVGCLSVKPSMPLVNREHSSLMNLPVDVLLLILQHLTYKERLPVALVSKRLRNLTNNPRMFPLKFVSLRIFYSIMQRKYIVRAPSKLEILHCKIIQEYYAKAIQNSYNSVVCRVPGKDSSIRLSWTSITSCRDLKCRLKQIIFTVENSWFNFSTFNFIKVGYQRTGSYQELYKIPILTQGSIIQVCLLDHTKVYIRDSYNKEYIVDFQAKPKL